MLHQTLIVDASVAQHERKTQQIRHEVACTVGSAVDK
jgi:hypothetical protein